MPRGFGFGVLRAPLVVLGVVTLTFGLLHAAPGSPVSHLLGPGATDLDIAMMTRSLGLDQPVAEQYLRWIGRAVRGDFGISIATGQSVTRMLATAWPATVILVGLSIALSYLIGLLVAAIETETKRRWLGRGLSLATAVLAALPGYWLAFVLVLSLSYGLRWFPAFGAAGIDAEFLTPGRRVADRLAHLALPLLTLTLIGIGTIARYARGTLAAVGQAPFLVTARAKGATSWAVLFRHHLRNGLIPLVALLGLSLPALFSGAVFVEGVFAWPGVGQVLIQAVQARDYPVVMAATTISAILVVIGSLIAEQLLRVVDPRIRG
jgi:peptide/nickel transport system permease protein